MSVRTDASISGHYDESVVEKIPSPLTHSYYAPSSAPWKASMNPTHFRSLHGVSFADVIDENVERTNIVDVCAVKKLLHLPKLRTVQGLRT
jgi:hypothetical protein